ncbi:helix-turn-helix transcriptional regulator [Allokutzneria oryzae]|uniref:Helix-turn-helix transcriptional regulator n=1 Tax=Allokutzneria oryzae TaxID=1378989 RepID=A0ABV6A932_9PSEU
MPELRGEIPSQDETGQSSLNNVSLLTGRWLSTEQLSAMLGVDSSTLRRWRTAEPIQGPPFVRLTSRVTMYSTLDVEKYLRGKRIVPGAAA